VPNMLIWGAGSRCRFWSMALPSNVPQMATGK
jgi:hypothetical protein